MPINVGNAAFAGWLRSSFVITARFKLTEKIRYVK